ncbi:DUF934 domain-containing protein [Roseicyclus mahoneyensis]|uniref:Uncharacterized protein (DUF934 family) n=1 Tax=Roseicyclus mahoneyensis TaxID=164332 RepID=A0A316GS09_9RHOB|nr:DUF934 domain-containing protein [Roseicyclus mahoneyensis]PWK62852.1 uncharacterized protein (DUF934 family) [Roseicyclus mahoneyensis]
MAILMQDDGFREDDWAGQVVPLAEAGAVDVLGIDLDPGEDLAELAPHLGRIALIRIRFGAFNDGRGFTVARRLRAMGYTGRLRAAGPVLADQYAMARRAGFDEIELAPQIAARQPEDQWLARADWRAGDHQARLRG